LKNERPRTGLVEIGQDLKAIPPVKALYQARSREKKVSRTAAVATPIPGPLSPTRGEFDVPVSSASWMKARSVERYGDEKTDGRPRKKKEVRGVLVRDPKTVRNGFFCPRRAFRPDIVDIAKQM